MILRTITIPMNKDFQSRYISDETSSRYMFWENSMSWERNSTHCLSWPLAIPHNITTKTWCETVTNYFKSVSDYSRVTDDVPVLYDDPKILALGYWFPKTNHSFCIRLSTVKMSTKSEAALITNRVDFINFIIAERKRRQS